MARLSAIPSQQEIRVRLAPLFKDEGLRLVILFGSAASGAVHPRSDIDLAFLYDKPIDAVMLAGRVIQLLRTDKVDVVDLRRASPLLKFSAAKHGKILFEKVPGMFSDFYSLAFRMYCDSRKLRDAQADSIRMYLKSRGLR